jgi:5-methylthioadenosine/S-adenosylhomocysteine deaminase
LTDNDRRIFAEKGAFVAHNPVSNLKLGSGVMPLRQTLDAGVCVTLGTDGVASNNNLDVLKEMQYAVLLAKGISRRPESVTAGEMLPLATRNGALAQGRTDCGKIETGYRADAILLDIDALHNIPSYGYETTLLYSAHATDVRMTMVDGRVLYRNGEYTTIDVEKLKYKAKDVIKHYFD